MMLTTRHDICLHHHQIYVNDLKRKTVQEEGNIDMKRYEAS